MLTQSPVLYSYRRCPYAMRARMALKHAGIDVEIREISLREKPEHLLAVSAKGTVPVLILPDGTVVDESLDIMQWALNQSAGDSWLKADMDETRALVAENDGYFKKALDAYKYADRYPEKTQVQHRADGEVFLMQLEQLLNENLSLLGELTTFADIAIFPFIRQFKGVDSQWFDTAPYPKVNAWLMTLIESELFVSVMKKHPTYLG